jgi:hypothetical protein
MWPTPRNYKRFQNKREVSPILSSEKMLHKIYNHKSSVGKQISGRGSEGAWRQDELIGSKPLVVK